MIFLDTGAFIARYIERDQHHFVALKCWQTLETKATTLYTSNFVLDETFTLLSRWTEGAFASKIANNIYRSSVLTILRPDLDDELEALRLFEKYADQKVSFTDCISSVLMRKKSLSHIFTFDNHFSILKWKIIPEQT